MSLESTVGIGVISGIISSACFSLFLLTIKPKVKISDQISKERENDEWIYRIKIVNHTHAMITNLKYTLHYCEMHTDGINTIHEIKPRKSNLVSIDKYTCKKNCTDYAVRLSYIIDEQKYPMKENCKLLFTFIADHAWSNTTTCIRKEYTANDIVEGMFETDKSLKVLKKVH